IAVFSRESRLASAGSRYFKSLSSGSPLCGGSGSWSNGKNCGPRMRSVGALGLRLQDAILRPAAGGTLTHPYAIPFDMHPLPLRIVLRGSMTGEVEEHKVIG